MEHAARWIAGTSPAMTWVCKGRCRRLKLRESADSLDDRRLHAGQRGIEVLPMRIGPLDQVELPRAGPLLHGLLALDRFAHVAVLVVPNQRVHLVLAREGGALARAMLLDSKDDPVGHADIQRPPRPARQDV